MKQCLKFESGFVFKPGNFVNWDTMRRRAPTVDFYANTTAA
jgi:hypothetical protein